MPILALGETLDHKNKWHLDRMEEKCLSNKGLKCPANTRHLWLGWGTSHRQAIVVDSDSENMSNAHRSVSSYFQVPGLRQLADS